MEPDSSSNDEDSIPLSQLLGSPNTKTKTLTIPIPAKTPKNFKKNDRVWAKIPPHSWSPAQITAATCKSTASVSLFVYNDTHLLEFSEMCEFEPKEMMGFVKDVAVCAWVGVDDAAGAARLSAQVNVRRHYVSVCRTSGVDGGFRADNLLGFLKSLSLSWGSDEWEGACSGREVEQIDAYRRFVCVRPDWMLPRSAEVEGGSVSEDYEEFFAG